MSDRTPKRIADALEEVLRKRGCSPRDPLHFACESAKEADDVEHELHARGWRVRASFGVVFGDIARCMPMVEILGRRLRLARRS